MWEEHRRQWRSRLRSQRPVLRVVARRMTSRTRCEGTYRLRRELQCGCLGSQEELKRSRSCVPTPQSRFDDEAPKTWIGLSPIYLSANSHKSKFDVRSLNSTCKHVGPCSQVPLNARHPGFSAHYQITHTRPKILGATKLHLALVRDPQCHPKRSRPQ